MFWCHQKSWGGGALPRWLLRFLRPWRRLETMNFYLTFFSIKVFCWNDVVCKRKDDRNVCDCKYSKERILHACTRFCGRSQSEVFLNQFSIPLAISWEVTFLLCRFVRKRSLIETLHLMKNSYSCFNWFS